MTGAGFAAGDLPLASSRAASAWRSAAPLFGPILCGWFLFVILTSIGGLLPQPMRISTLGEYDPYMDDFVVFQGAGRLLWTDTPSDVYDVSSVHSEQAEVLKVPPESIIPLPFFNPPQTLPFFALFGLSNRVVGAVIWTVGSLGLFASACWLLRELSGSPLRSVTTLAVLLGIACSMPAYEVILHGQTSFLLVVGLLLFYKGSIRGKAPAIGAMGLAILAMKPQLAIVPFGYVIATGQWRVVIGAGVLHAAALTASVGLFGLEVVPAWVRLMVEASAWEDQNGIWIHAMFGWNGFVRALLGPDLHLVRQVVVLLLSAGTIGGSVWILLRRRTSHEGKLLVLTSCALLISPHLFAQDLILLAVPIALLCVKQSSEQLTWIVYGLGGWVLTLAHFPWLFPDPDVLAVNFVTLWMAASLFLLAVPEMRLPAVGSRSTNAEAAY